MAGMQRFVTYIYAYENSEKTSNVGYAKIETRGSKGQIEIHLATNGVSGGEAKVSFLYIREGKCEELPFGVLRLENGRGIGQYTFHTEMMLDTTVPFEKVVGIKMEDSLRQRYMSFWKDVELPKEEAAEELEEKVLTGDTQPDSTEASGKVEAEVLKDAEQESLHTMEIPMRNVFPIYSMDDIWRNFEKKRDSVQINNEVCAVQIELNDIRELPKKYWYLGNNSFLLHGFFNYHYLLMGELPGNRWFLGIPGVYERQERVMASIFGFPGFIPVSELTASETVPPSQEKTGERQQGVWYHILED